LSSELEHVLWIGGGQGAGKTSAARVLARRHGLRTYLVDAFAFAHAERASTGEFAVMNAFAARTLDERWLEPEPADMAEQFFSYSRERFALIVEDLRRLPRHPAVVAEGPQLLPQLIAPLLDRAEAALWLIPAPDLQRRLRTVRPSATLALTSDPVRAGEKIVLRDELIAAWLREAALERGLRIVETDSYEDALKVVEDQLGPLAQGAGVADPDAVRELRREENLIVLDQLRRYAASEEAPPNLGGASSYPFGCECARLGCRERVELEVSAYEDIVQRGEFVSAHLT
jgi:hypothetical protein